MQRSLAPAVTSLLASLVTSASLAQVVVVDVPQYGTSTRYDFCTLSSDGNYAAFTTNETTRRLVRWNAGSNALTLMDALPTGSGPVAQQVTNIGSIAGYQMSGTLGAVWYTSGSVAPSPFPGSTIGVPAAAAANGAVYFIVDAAQSTMYEWNSLGTPVSRGRPAGTTFVRPFDVNANGTACAVAGTLGGVTRTYRWTAAGGYELLPLLDGTTTSYPSAISEDGTRLIGVSYTSSSQQAFFWSAATGLVSMGLPNNAVISALNASGDCTLACGKYALGGVSYPFVWSLHGGLTTASAFAIARGYNPGTTAFEVLDFNKNGTIALVRRGDATKLLKNLYRSECGVSGNCYLPQSAAGCADASCCDRVCAVDPYCCNTNWDVQCAEEAQALCRTGATCSDPRRLSSLVPSSFDYNTAEDATLSDDTLCAKGDSKAVWRIYRAPCTGAVTVDTCTEFVEGPIVLSVFWECGSQIACNEGAFVSCGSTRANVAFPAIAGINYLIRIASIGGNAAGNISIACETVCGGSGPNNCTASHAAPGCSDAACCGTVCVNDPYCCDVGWDIQCASEARSWCYRPADFDFDGDIDAADLAELLSKWGLPGATDLDGDGSTGASDLAVLLGNWG